MSDFTVKALTPETFDLVEGYPHDTGGVRKKNSSFLYNGTRTMK